MTWGSYDWNVVVRMFSMISVSLGVLSYGTKTIG